MPESLLKWIRPEIRELSAYHVPDAEGLIKLDAMENPFQIEGEDKAVWMKAVAAAQLNRYPDPSARALKSALKRAMQPPVGTAMVLGNGSDELIQMLAMTVAGKDRCIMSLDPGFVMYRMIAEFVGMQYVGVPLNKKFDIDLVQTLKAIHEHEPAIIFIAYPNNPSANCFYEGSIDEIIKAAPGIVVIDEAYHPFAQKSYLDRLTEFDHLMVMRTVSKMGLAGLRLGALFGHPLLVGEIDKVRLPYNINSLTQAAATAVLKQPDVLAQQAKQIREQRELLLKAMDEIAGIVVFHSDANFILFRVESREAETVFESLKQQGVLIKNMKASAGPLQGCLRVTVGTASENAMFLMAIRNAMGL